MSKIHPIRCGRGVTGRQRVGCLGEAGPQLRWGEDLDVRAEAEEHRVGVVE